MNHIIKISTLLLVIFLFTACEKDEVIQQLSYEKQVSELIEVEGLEGLNKEASIIDFDSQILDLDSQAKFLTNDGYVKVFSDVVRRRSVQTYVKSGFVKNLSPDCQVKFVVTEISGRAGAEILAYNGVSTRNVAWTDNGGNKVDVLTVLLSDLKKKEDKLIFLASAHGDAQFKFEIFLKC